MNNPRLLDILASIAAETDQLLYAPIEQLSAVLERRLRLLEALQEETSCELPPELLAPVFHRLQALVLATQRAETRIKSLRNEAISEVLENQRLHTALTRYGAAATAGPVY